MATRHDIGDRFREVMEARERMIAALLALANEAAHADIAQDRRVDIVIACRATSDGLVDLTEVVAKAVIGS